MSFLDYAQLEATALRHDPYDYMIVPNCVSPARLDALIADYPQVPGPGSHPPSELSVYGNFQALLDEMNAARFRAVIEQKFDLDLSARPTMFTVRGYCRRNDGAIHTDSDTKIITVLLYLNQAWESDGGRLRILRSGDSLDDAAAEVPPQGGTLLAFRRSATSWHGHEPFEGRRRAVQMNWVMDEKVVAYEQRRHRLSTTIKKLNPFRRSA